MNENFELKTDRLLLRNYEHSDWERVHLYGADPGFSKYEQKYTGSGPEELYTVLLKKFIKAPLKEKLKERR